MGCLIWRIDTHGHISVLDIASLIDISGTLHRLQGSHAQISLLDQGHSLAIANILGGEIQI